MRQTRSGLPISVDPRTGRARRTPNQTAPTTAHEAIVAGGSPRGHAYRSKWEESFAAYLRGLAGIEAVSWWAYEPITIHLAPGLRYTPDFVALHVPDDPTDERQVMIYEVKGWSRNRREGIAKLKMAAQQLPWARFVLIEYRGTEQLFTDIRSSARVP